MSRVIEILKIIGAEKIIEAGASGIPLCRESILLNYPDFNLNNTPYDILDKSCDCFVALQVWEHLDKQVEAFQEVRRISRSAILSFPYRWTHGDARHRGINHAKIMEWSSGLEPVHVEHIDSRAIYFWRF